MLQAAYEGFVANIKAALPPEDLDCMYFYPSQYLHLTIASPASFIHPDNEPRGFASMEAAYQAAVRPASLRVDTEISYV